MCSSVILLWQRGQRSISFTFFFISSFLFISDSETEIAFSFSSSFSRSDFTFSFSSDILPEIDEIASSQFFAELNFRLPEISSICLTRLSDSAVALANCLFLSSILSLRENISDFFERIFFFSFSSSASSSFFFFFFFFFSLRGHFFFFPQPRSPPPGPLFFFSFFPPYTPHTPRKNFII